MQALSSPRALRVSLALAALTVCGAASAASTEYDFSIPTTSTSWVVSESLAKFNPVLGTLTSVDFELGGVMVTQPVFANGSANSSATITNTTTGHYYILGSGSLASTMYYSNNSAPYTTSANVPAAQTVTGSQTTLAFANTPTNATDAATLAQFIGTGPLSLTFMASAVSNGSGSGNTTVSNVTNASGLGYVRYNYIQATPEPTSCVAFAVGALGLLRRRKAVVR